MNKKSVELGWVWSCLNPALEMASFLKLCLLYPRALGKKKKTSVGQERNYYNFGKRGYQDNLEKCPFKVSQ